MMATRNSRSRATLVPPQFAAAIRGAFGASSDTAVDPWFFAFDRQLSSEAGLRTYCRALWQTVSLIGGVEGRDILDAGSGFGSGANLLAHWGARRVYAVELHRQMVASHRHLLRRYFSHLDNVHPIRADVRALPIHACSVDVVLSVEAISHYEDVEAFLDECQRVLRRGGALVISDGNNGANARIRRFTEDLWQRWENGPHGVVGDHDIRETFSERRARIIRAAFPDLADSEVESYAANTAGFDRAQIEAAITAHRAGGAAPQVRYKRGDLAREPDLGIVAERLFDPMILGRAIDARGFDVQVLPHFAGAKNDLLSAANAVLRRLRSFRYARGFRLVARKR